jgi:hypothetical protein
LHSGHRDFREGVITYSGGLASNFSALVASGADATLIPVDILNAIGAPVIRTRTMRGINNTRHLVDIIVTLNGLAGVAEISV